jgi:hypothetical protein
MEPINLNSINDELRKLVLKNPDILNDVIRICDMVELEQAKITMLKHQPNVLEQLIGGKFR